VSKRTRGAWQPVAVWMAVLVGTAATVNAQSLPVLDVWFSTVSEGHSGVTLMPFTVKLSAPSAIDVTFRYETHSTGATPGVDYLDVSGTATIPAGYTVKVIPFPVFGDTLIEGAESIGVRVSEVTGATVGVAGALATIVDDDSPAAAQEIATYRLYNTDTAEHLYTTDLNEYAVLGTRGWIQEGNAWRMFRTTGTVGGGYTMPLFRLYHIGTGQHLWTTDANEARVLGVTRDWQYEGVTAYLAPPVAGTVPLYRMALPSPPVHLWTIDENEYRTLQGSTPPWIPEGIIGYVLP
jgi:hypothetical protein